MNRVFFKAMLLVLFLCFTMKFLSVTNKEKDLFLSDSGNTYYLDYEEEIEITKL